MKKNILIITLVVGIGIVAAGICMVNSSSKEQRNESVVEKVDSDEAEENIDSSKDTISSDNSDSSTSNNNGGEANTDGNAINPDSGTTNPDSSATKTDSGTNNTDSVTTSPDTNTTNPGNSTSKTDSSTTNTNGNTTNNDSSTSPNKDGSAGTVTNGDSTTTPPVASEVVSIAIGEVQGKVGSEVVVPVNIANIPQLGIGTCDFKVGYDNRTLELVEVTSGEVVINSSLNFSAQIDNNSGVVSFLYLDNTLKNEAITKTGTFANLKFRVKEGTSGVQEVKVKSIGTFANNDLKEYEIKATGGKININ